MKNHSGTGQRFRRVATALAFVSLTLVSCPKAGLSGKFDSFKPLKENTQSTVTAKWPGGECKLEPSTGQIAYKLKDGKIFEFEAPRSPDGEPFALSCGQDATVIVTPEEIMVVAKGASNKKDEAIELLGSVSGSTEGSEKLASSDTVKNPPEVKNIGAVESGDKLFVLAKDEMSADYELMVVDKKKPSVLSAELGKIFEGNVGMFSYKGVVFIAGESKKGKNYLFSFVVGDKLSGEYLKAGKELKGEVSFEEKDDFLLLKIGKRAIRITVSTTSGDLPNNKNRVCFKSSADDDKYICVTASPLK